MAENPPILSTNRLAILSLVTSLFTVLSFCIAVVPIPFTGWVCYPAAGVTGLIALMTGLISLKQIRANGENGGSSAWLARGSAV